MRDKQVKILLFLAILVMTVLPMMAALYFLDRSLQTSLDLGFNPHIVRVLDDEARNLKTLRGLDPSHQEEYRAQFERVDELRQVYGNRTLVTEGIRGSLTIYFGVGLIAAVLLSILLATFLSRRITQAYSATYNELARQQERVRYLEEMSSWQELAKILAHEIKNPLTPIEVLITSLSKAYLGKSTSEFQTQLESTKTMINEELAHLKNTVNKFSEFARLPAVRLEREDLGRMIEQQTQAVGASFTTARIAVQSPSTPIIANVDATLFRQILTNIVRNGVEANTNRDVQFRIAITQNHGIEISIANDGVVVPEELASRMFDPYVSSKSGKENMGLGLAIVRKIVIEHGGDIEYRVVDARPTFVVTLPSIPTSN